MESFAVSNPSSGRKPSEEKRSRPRMALRRMRPPAPVRVQLDALKPVAFRDRGQSYKVAAAYGPWRSSGCWWSTEAWNTEEWDVLAEAGSGSSVACLLVHDCTRNQWQLEAFMTKACLEATEYIELHAASAFSFLAGASQPEALIERAAELDMPAMALADRNGLYGVARFHTAAKKTWHQGAHRRGDCGQFLRQPAHAARVAAASVPGRARAHCCCSAHRKPAIRISASSSRASRCAKPPRPKARRRSTISKSFPPD